ncbi:hypothetical protein [Endozoicomonas sp.]|uniref:hypothetical protein n=1 Tax=Endozoicomonas sp. TaxID=1892382 RepID=UPI0028838AAF|nr:hypothetical protein [Endozoicomonas sp.]
MAKRSLPILRKRCTVITSAPVLQCLILHQYFGSGVTQPQIKELLWDIGISISAGEVNNLVIHDHEEFHAEKDEILATGIRCSRYLQTDDTGARHQGAKRVLHLHWQ